jgi:hypothetical protein
MANMTNGNGKHDAPRVTTSVLFLRSLLEAGITTCFVNLGMIRSQRERHDTDNLGQDPVRASVSDQRHRL